LRYGICFSFIFCQRTIRKSIFSLEEWGRYKRRGMLPGGANDSPWAIVTIELNLIL
jgi:hypothetical protein